MTTTTQMQTTQASWEQVLAQVEEDVRRTEAMLAGAAMATNAAAAVDGQHLAPAEMMLPAAGPELPPLVSMPPIPVEMLDRIVALRARINALREEIESELSQWRQGQGRQSTDAVAHLRAASAAAAAPPRFVDRQL